MPLPWVIGRDGCKICTLASLYPPTFSPLANTCELKLGSNNARTNSIPLLSYFLPSWCSPLIYCDAHSLLSNCWFINPHNLELWGLMNQPPPSPTHTYTQWNTCPDGLPEHSSMLVTLQLWLHIWPSLDIWARQSRMVNIYKAVCLPWCVHACDPRWVSCLGETLSHKEYTHQGHFISLDLWKH